MTHPQTIFGSISFAVSVLLTVVNSSSMNGAQSETATGLEGESNSVDAAAGSTGDQAATTNHNWESMEVQFLARAEAEGREGILRFGSQADLMEFLTAHLQACSTTTLEKCLASQGRTATDDWSWEDFKDVAMRCQELAPKTNAGNQTDTTSELCEKKIGCVGSKMSSR